MTEPDKGSATIFAACDAGTSCPSFRYVWLLGYFARRPHGELHPAIKRLIEALARDAARRDLEAERLAKTRQ